MNTPNQKFPKYERLKSTREIGALFESGSTFLVYPLKVVWDKASPDNNSPVQVAFTVSRKLFKSAVVRNRIKRRMREAFRLNKNMLYPEIPGNPVLAIFIYVGRVEEPYSLIDKSMKTSLKKLRH